MKQVMKFQIITVNGFEFRISYYYQFERFYGGKWHNLRDSTIRANRIPVLLYEGQKIRLPFCKHVYRVKYLSHVELQPVYTDFLSSLDDEYLYIRGSSKERYSSWSKRCSELGLLDLAMINIRASMNALSDVSESLRL